MHPTLDLRELQRKIGRLFMAGMPGFHLDDDTEALIRDYCLGGIILFSRNIQDPLQLAGLCNELQERAMKYHGIPLFLAIDQEGGPVARLREPFTVFPGNAVIGAAPEPEKMASRFARITAKEMTLVGLNMNLAPVVDVRVGELEAHLEGRIFGDDAVTVALLGRTVIEGLQERGVMAVAKHFPGLGAAPVDPHEELPKIRVDRKDLDRVHLPPFREAFACGVCGVMSSHAIYPALDPHFPATLSPGILSDLLRDTLGFEGLVITDDLQMGAIAGQWDVPHGAVGAFEAGADILLICHDQALVLDAIRLLVKKVLNGEVSIGRLHRSLERIGKAKNRFLKGTGAVSLEQVEAYFGGKGEARRF